MSFLLNKELKNLLFIKIILQLHCCLRQVEELQEQKHLCARMHLAMEATMEKKILVLYKHTSKMIADSLLKTLTGQAFKDFKNISLGTTSIKD